MVQLSTVSSGVITMSVHDFCPASTCGSQCKDRRPMSAYGRSASAYPVHFAFARLSAPLGARVYARSLWLYTLNSSSKCTSATFCTPGVYADFFLSFASSFKFNSIVASTFCRPRRSSDLRQTALFIASSTSPPLRRNTSVRVFVCLPIYLV